MDDMAQDEMDVNGPTEVRPETDADAFAEVYDAVKEQAEAPRSRRQRPAATLAEPVELLADVAEDEPVVWQRPEVSVSELRAGADPAAEDVVRKALTQCGFHEKSDTFREAYARLQRYLGHGRPPSGVPDLGSLTWLGLRTQSFTATD
jgi:hypothetical protein